MFPERPELPTLTREFQRLMSTGALPPDALDGLVPDDDASDGDMELAKPAADDEESMHLAIAESMYLAMARNLIGKEAYKLRMGVDCADDDVDRQDLAAAKALIDEEADMARRRRMSVDYASDEEEEEDQSNADEQDCQSNADDEPAVSNAADLYAMYAAAFEEDDEEEAGKDYGPHWRLHPDYQSFPANEPEDEDDDVGELPPDFLGPRVPSPRRSLEPEDMDEGAGPSTKHARHVHYDDEDDVIIIKAGQYDQYSSSSSGSGSPSLTNSDRSSSPERFSDQDAQLARDAEQLAKAAERPCSPTPDADGIPHFASEDIDMNSKYTLGLQFKSDDEILAGFFGEGHGAVLSSIHPTPPPPPPPPTTTQNAPPPAPPAPAPTEHMSIRPELARRLEEVARPCNELKRTMNGDAYIPDGAGGYMSARTGRHVDQAFAGDFQQRQEANTLRNLAERINAGQVIVTIVDDQPTSSASDDDADSVEEQLEASISDDADSVEEQLAASTSDEEVSSSQEQQTVDVQTPPTRKRSRSDSEEDDEASSEKRRRVRSEEQLGSRAVLRLRSRAPSPSPALGSSTAATQNDLHVYTAAAAAPHADGPAVVEPTERAADGSDEAPVASTSALPAAEQAQEPAPSANVPARRSTRVRANAEAARVRAAEEARRAAEASPVPKPRGKGQGKGKGKGRQ